MTEKYDRIGDTYDTTRAPDPEIVALLNRHLGPTPAGAYLDIGSGTGNYTSELAKIAGTWTGLEPSSQMLGEARAKSDAITWVQGISEDLPFEDAAFDGAMCTLAIHHFTNFGKAMAEADRVLRPGARFVIFHTTPEQVSRYWPKRYFPQMFARDMKQLPSIEEIETALAATSLSIRKIDPFDITADIKDFFFYSGKFHPEMYLSKNVRAGMSNFRTLITDEELTSGLAALEQDIKSGAIKQIIKDSLHDGGDYCFIVLEKG